VTDGPGVPVVFLVQYTAIEIIEPGTSKKLPTVPDFDLGKK
jgi:hypothetical protein